MGYGDYEIFSYIDSETAGTAVEEAKEFIKKNARPIVRTLSVHLRSEFICE